MPLINFYNNSKHSVLEMTIKQIVAMAGDGNLKDNSDTSTELREFLSTVPTKYLTQYIETCLTSSFDCSGFVLQDIINELGKRLGYSVQPGLYRGKVNSVGFDGIWKVANSRDIIIEAKTTDYYTISLDKIFDYKKRLVNESTISPDAMILFVVGRDDSNSLEAQIRGSRYAWDARLLSVESLLQMVMIKEKTQDATTLEKIRALIEPIEYTRLDRLVDVVFLTVEDAEKSIEEESILQPENSAAATDSLTKPKQVQEYTDPEAIQEKRDFIADKISLRRGMPFNRQRRGQFESADGAERLHITISKRYGKQGQQSYWYSYHPHNEKYLREVERGYLVLGMMDNDDIYMIPEKEMNNIKDDLSTTTKDNRTYWHLTIYQNANELLLSLPKKNERLSLEKYRL